MAKRQSINSFSLDNFQGCSPAFFRDPKASPPLPISLYSDSGGDHGCSFVSFSYPMTGPTNVQASQVKSDEV